MAAMPMAAILMAAAAAQQQLVAAPTVANSTMADEQERHGHLQLRGSTFKVARIFPAIVARAAAIWTAYLNRLRAWALLYIWLLQLLRLRRDATIYLRTRKVGQRSSTLGRVSETAQTATANNNHGLLISTIRHSHT